MLCKILFIAVWAVFLASSSIVRAEQFVVTDIRVEGLQRITAGSVFTALPINVGDRISQASIANAIRTLFRTGNFDDIQIGKDGNILVVTVEERPSISEINIEGNKVIETESLLEGLSGAGLAEGKVFKRSTLESMKMELGRQYVSQGRYDAEIETDVVSLPRNRVAVNINIDEGNTAAIEYINIVGNHVYDESELRSEFELKSTGWLSWITSDNKYAKEKLSGDLETLSSYYLDRGYINFAIDSTQVSVTPDRQSVYITVNVNEGELFTVGEVDLSGDMVIPENQLRAFIFVQPGQTFSQSLVTATEEWLTKRLGNDGYNFAKVEGIPDIDKETKTVNLKFFIDPGKRTYVRQINFVGNSRTADDILRREMRQMEAAPASSSSIEQSRIRLNRLGYFKEVNVETNEVPGTDDLIDLDYVVEEQSSGSIGASIGFSQDSGLIFGANVQQNNFLGTGKQIGIGLNKSDFLSNIRFSYLNPYYTVDGVSRGFSVFYRVADLEEANISSYTTNTLGANVSFGYPIKETERLNFSLGWANTEIETGQFAVQEIVASPRKFEPVGESYTQYYVTQRLADGTYAADEIPLSLDTAVFPEPLEPGFLDVHGNEFDNFTFSISWNQSTLNRGSLATRGHSQGLAFEVTMPSSDLEFYKLTYTGQVFFPVTQGLTLRLRTELGIGGGFGDTEELPFFQHFYSGGFGSVRGFKSNTLGPRSTPAILYQTGQAAIDVSDPAAIQFDNKLSYVAIDDGSNRIGTVLTAVEGDPFGGNVLIEASMELLFPLPFIEDQRSIRSAFFIDIGNVFDSTCGQEQLNCFNVKASELRFSYGLGVSWITGFGPLTFSYAIPINDSVIDETEAFQFTLGRSF
jgi:outer membrane protein insertion porin family